MDHRAEDDALVEQYANGTLRPEEIAPFEEHLVGCAECAERLLWTERLQAGLRTLAADAAGAAEGAERDAAARIAPPLRPRRAAPLPLALAAGLVAALGAGGILLHDRGRLRREVAEQQAGSDQWRSRYEAERRERETAPPGPAAPALPRGNVPVLLLSAVRGGAPRHLPALDLVPGQDFALLSLEVEPEVAFVAYAARLQGPGAREVWRTDDLQPAAAAVTMLLPAELLPPGPYAVTLEGVRGDGRRVPVGAYGFLTRRR